MNRAQSHCPRRLTPEEDSIGDPDDDEEIDDLLPADLWFCQADGSRPAQSVIAAHRILRGR